jgi:CRISPR-associated protein Csx17
MVEVILTGCQPEPLGSYLKALGVLRLVGAQLDPAACGRWTADGFALTGPTREELVAFFTDRYRPTPLVAPWNGSSGFRPNDQQAGIAAIEASTHDRLATYRHAIAEARAVVAWAEQTGRSKERTKGELLEACRARLPDEAVAWIDAAAVLVDDGVRFPPLLGTGGNVGRLEFSNNFMQRLAEVLCLRQGRGAPTPSDARRWLEAALFADQDAPRVAGPIGQFDPGAAGGVNAAPVGDAPSLVNPWEYVLLLEGALLFASAAARRLGAQGRAGAGLPFMVAASPVGYASGTPGEPDRGELWAPMWERPTTARELAYLIGEGRADWQRRQARTGLDLARAATSLGVDRGISAFVRHAFVERFGRSMLAVPAGRIAVRDRPEIPVLGQLDAWLTSARGGNNPPAAVAAALRRVDAAMMALTRHGGARQLQDVLVATAEAELAVGRATSFRERAHLGPVDGLSAGQWLPQLGDGLAELRVAAALASQHERASSLRFLLRPIKRNEKTGRLEWTKRPVPPPSLGVAALPQVLAGALVRRAVEAQTDDNEADTDGKTPADELVGVQTAYPHRVGALLEDVARLVDDRLDQDRLDQLVPALLLLDWHDASGQPLLRTPVPPLERPPHPAWALLAPFFHGRPITLGRRRPGQVRQASGLHGPQPRANPHLGGQGRMVHLIPEVNWPALLLAGRIEPVVSAALRRLRIARLDPLIRDPAAVALGVSGQRLAAALTCPITPTAASLLLRRVAIDLLSD